VLSLVNLKLQAAECKVNQNFKNLSVKKKGEKQNKTQNNIKKNK